MKQFLTVGVLCMFGALGVAQAADLSCADRAAEKKLAGAAKSSFMKKCERDAAAATAAETCTAKAAEKKLAGAAKNSFVKKCEKDAAAAK